MARFSDMEDARLSLQARLDAAKSQAERNRLGQFATPTALAHDILQYARRTVGKNGEVRFLDPALGTGSFFSAFLETFGENSFSNAVGYEIDGHYGKAARELWEHHRLDVRLEDFTQAAPPLNDEKKPTLVICNPPYVRHHHIAASEKARLGGRVAKQHGISLSGLSGLYCYFLCLSKDWMSRGGIGAWLIPSEFMDVNYGKAIKDFLLDHVTLLHIHRFSPDDVQFGDALVSSAVVWIKNAAPPPDHQVRFSFGGSLSAPMVEKPYTLERLRQENKWTILPRTQETDVERFDVPAHVLGDFFNVKRGIATGANEFFILSPSDAVRRAIPRAFLRPILPSPRYLATDLVESTPDGIPRLDKFGFLFSSDKPETAIRQEFPTVWRYLVEGRDQGISERYICRNRSPWYFQEKREATSFLCTYMGRTNGNGESRPFRFILNRSKAIAPNVYLMLYPKPWVKNVLQRNPALTEKTWLALRSIPMERLLGEGRVYGGGLYKMEPKELLRAPATELSLLFPSEMKAKLTQSTFF